MVTLLYVTFFVLGVIALFPPRKRFLRQLILIGCGLILGFEAGLRTEACSPDYSNYLFLYESAGESFVVEPTFIGISLFVKAVFGHPVFLFLIYAACAVVWKLKAIHDISELWFLGILTYFSSLFLIQELAQIRAGVATALILVAIKPLYERNGKWFLLLGTIATLFHYSACLVFPLWFLPLRKYNKWILYGLIPFGYIIYLSKVNLLTFTFPFPQIQSKIESYQAMQEAGLGGFDQINVFGVGLLMKCVIYYLLLFFRPTLEAKNCYVTILLYIYAIGIFLVPAFAVMPVVALRTSALFVSVEILLFPMLAYIFKPPFIGRCLVVLIAGVNIFISLTINELIW